MRKCKPGVICIENTTLFIIFLMVFLTFTFYIIYNKPTNIKDTNNITINTKEQNDRPINTSFIPSWPYTNLPINDVLLNPYSPPLSDERYLVPINIPTNIGSVNTSYRQMGILTPFNESSADKILQLMGRPLFTNRDKWQYYTISNTGSFNTKLPVSVNGKSCTSEYGCDSINNGDTIYVEGYNDTFRATIYETSSFQYIPQL